VWKANDKVELTFPLFVQFSRLQDNQNAVAFTYRPLVLSAGLGTDNMTTAPQGVQVLQATKPAGLQETLTINSTTTINAWLSNLRDNRANREARFVLRTRIRIASWYSPSLFAPRTGGIY
jgi:DUF1680 family protein